VVVGVCEKDLDRAIRAEFGVIEQFDAAGFEAGGSGVGVFDGEGDVVIAG
jgi:hypothetical protein